MAIFPNLSNITISGINTENTSTASNSLKTLSDTSRSGTDPADGAPYAMSEFQNYAHTAPFTSQSTTGTFSQFTQGKNSCLRRRFDNFSDATLVLGAAGNTHIYTIYEVTSKEGTGPSSADTDQRQGLVIRGIESGNISNPPTGWSTITMSNASITWTKSASDFTITNSYSSTQDQTFWTFRIDDETLYLSQTSTGTLTFS